MAERFASCRCGNTKPSSLARDHLAFFEDCGPGSREATEICKCGFHKVAHERQPRNVDPRSVIERGECKGFEARGPQKFDRYYCGCDGWD